MNKEFTAIPRLFNNSVQSAKKYGSESMHNMQGQYINNGWDRIYYDGHLTSTTFKDNNRDYWVDEIIVKKNGTLRVEAKNTNPYQDNLFDLYKEYDNGKLSKVVQDKDKNGQYDYVELYEYGIISQTIEDITNDGNPDIYTFYNLDGSIAEQIDTRSGWEKLLDSIF